MASIVQFRPVFPGDHESRLTMFGLSTPLIHNSFLPGLQRARNRTGLALKSSPGTDLYHDTFEQLALALAPSGWRLVPVNRQPRLIHPDGLMGLVVASAIGVAGSDHRHRPVTNRKGHATLASINREAANDHTPLDLPEFQLSRHNLALAESAPLWMLLHEHTEHGLNIELAKPAGMTSSGKVDVWSDEIPVASVKIDGDLSAFDSDGIPDEFDVPVEPR